MKAYVFPGQGAQFTGMGKDLYESNDVAKRYFAIANEVLGFDLQSIMFNGSEDDLRQTKVTQPAVFVHSAITALCLPNFKPDMVAGHSLGEFTALVANKALTFEAALTLVQQRALAMQRACEQEPGTMAAILNLAEEVIEKICVALNDEGHQVVPANYNCPGQLVISGSIDGINLACERMKAEGAKRAMVLPVGGAFHSPLMEPARQELIKAINSTVFTNPICPVYQNVTANAVHDADQIKENLMAQLTGPVKWTQTIQQMIVDGATSFTEVGPGKVLQGLIKKINKEAIAESA
ncbi:MAG: hypothetical protein RIQ89_1309 [Bacteroidota bacterium]|jgi:[acyl-carrier-protein] S-malonyltransferase